MRVAYGDGEATAVDADHVDDVGGINENVLDCALVDVGFGGRRNALGRRSEFINASQIALSFGSFVIRKKK